MVELKEFLNESLYGAFLGFKNKAKTTLKYIKNNMGDAIDTLKDEAIKVFKSFRSIPLVLSASTLGEYNKQCDELMEMCANDDDRHSGIKLYFEKNKDKTAGDYTIYVVCESEYGWHKTDAFKDNKYYIIQFVDEYEFTLVTAEHPSKNMVEEFDKKFKDLGLRLPKTLSKWTDLLDELADIYLA